MSGRRQYSFQIIRKVMGNSTEHRVAHSEPPNATTLDFFGIHFRIRLTTRSVIRKLTSSDASYNALAEILDPLDGAKALTAYLRGAGPRT